jgi:hypothetical protein
MISQKVNLKADDEEKKDKEPENHYDFVAILEPMVSQKV